MNRWAGLAAGLMLAAGGCAPVMAQEPPEGFAWYVLKELNDSGFDIDDPTNRPPLVTEVPAGVLEAVDANGDDRTDWLIRWPEALQFCGTGGCRVTLYIGTQDGFVRAFDRQALRFEINGAHDGPRIGTALHAVHCNDGRPECLRTWVWDAEAARLRIVASSDGAVRPHEPPPVENDDGAAD